MYKKLEEENKELWSIISQMREEQDSYKNSIFISLKTFTNTMESVEIDQSSYHNKDTREVKDYREHRDSREEVKHAPVGRFDPDEYLKIEQSKIDQIMPTKTNTQSMNNAAGSGGNQDDFRQDQMNNEGEDDDSYVYFDEYNEEGTSGGNAKPLSHDQDYGRPKYDQNENNNEVVNRNIQGNERRGRQKQSNKRRQYNTINAQEMERDSGDDYEEEEKIPGNMSSSGTQSHSYKKNVKGYLGTRQVAADSVQNQAFSRASEGPLGGQFRNITRHDPRAVVETHVPSYPGQANQRHRQADPRQTYTMGGDSHTQNQPRRKDQKLSAESGGTEFNQYQSTTNQQEDFKSTGPSPNYQYDVNMQGSITSNTQRTLTKTNIPHLNIGQRTGSPEEDQRIYGNLGMGIGGNYDEDVLLGENEVSTPRRQEIIENESK